MKDLSLVNQIVVTNQRNWIQYQVILDRLITYFTTTNCSMRHGMEMLWQMIKRLLNLGYVIIIIKQEIILLISFYHNELYLITNLKWLLCQNWTKFSMLLVIFLSLINQWDPHGIHICRAHWFVKQGSSTPESISTMRYANP